VASVPSGSPSSELLERAVEAVARSRELCADTRRLMEEMRDKIVTARGTDRLVEKALRERKRLSARVSGTLRRRDESVIEAAGHSSAR
jgi:hypothetical protein